MKDTNTMQLDASMLIREALEARKNAWAPYSNFLVGAALLTGSGRLYRGCNIENAAFSSGICAERTAIFKAVSEGERELQAIAIVGGKRERTGLLDLAYPCGACRQVMREFCLPPFIIIVAASEEDYKSYTLAQMLPKSFSSQDLAGANPYQELTKVDVGKLYH